MKDLASNVDVRRVISPVSVADNTPQVGQVIDRLGYRSLTFVISVGAVADADATFAVLLEESDTEGSGYTSVSDHNLIGTEVAAGFQFDSDNQVRKIGYKGSMQYVRLTITPTFNASAAMFSVVAVLGHPLLSPAS